MRHQNVMRILALVFAMVMMLVITSCELFKQPEETTTQHTHTETVLEAKEATCTETGLTEGKKCSECDEIIVAQEVVPAKGHTEEDVAAVAATCTTDGLTAGKKCSVCDVTIEVQELVPATGHTAGAEATCTANQVCTVCEAVLVEAKGHTEGAEATCTTAQVCTVCNAELAPAKGHFYDKDVTTVTEATCGKAGTATAKCECGDSTTIEIPATGKHTWDAGYTKCTVCDYKIMTPEEAYALGMTFANTTDRTEEVYLKLTLDNQVNDNGFARGTVVVGKAYISVAGGYLSGDTLKAIQKGDIVLLKGKIGKVTSQLCDVPYETRLYDVTGWQIITCEHTYGTEIFNASACLEAGRGFVACTKCGARKEIAVTTAPGHDMVDGACTRCGTCELNEDDKAWLTAQGLDPNKYLKLDLSISACTGYYYNPQNKADTAKYGKWMATKTKYDMSTRKITKAEMGVGSVIRVDHIEKGDDGKWTKMLQYRPELFIQETAKGISENRQAALKVGGRIDVTEEWWNGDTAPEEGGKTPDAVTFTLTVLNVKEAADADADYVTEADKNYVCGENDYDNFVIYVLKDAQ